MKRMLLACVGLLSAASARPAQELPVFLADNHAETFAWITRTFDPDDSHLMVLVDAHSDASAVERSEEVREGLRRVAHEAERASRVQAWRKDGRLQAFNWIEPLMPRPVDRVLWLAAPELDDAAREAKRKEAIEQLDGRLEVEPRSAGSFSQRWEVCDLEGYTAWNPGPRPVILAIDLDFFAGMQASDREARFAAIWERAVDWPGLGGVAFAVSRPWLTDDAEADALVALVVDAVKHTRGAKLEIEAAPDDHPDHSLRAGELTKEGGKIPRWEFARVSPAVKMALGSLHDRLSIEDPRISWSAALASWADDFGQARIRPAGGGASCDGVWRYPVGSEPVLRVEAPADATGKVRWYRLEPARAAYDFLPGTGLGKDFSVSSGRWIYEKRRSLGETEDFQLDPARWRNGKAGRIRIAAECETSQGWLPVPPVELAMFTGTGFRAALSECMGMPYVFGIAGVSGHELSGVETGWGSDCANLLAYAWRRQGLPLAWGDPGRLRAQLATKAGNLRLADAVKITPQEIEAGIAIDFGRHVAALWEDREPLGVLDGNDLAMHHLGGLPEIVALSVLTEKRPLFSLRVPRPGGCQVAFAGDVVLAGEDRAVIEGFARGGADLFLANLEGIPSLRDPAKKPRYDFRFPPERLAWLKERGVDAVSLANNHALDAGNEGLIEGLDVLQKAGIATFGAGRTKEEACAPWRTERHGVKLAIFGISDLPQAPTQPGEPVVANLSEHREQLEEEFRKARAKGERIIVMIHGGSEYETLVSDGQREAARWLAAHGAVVIAGAHPHVVQREECHGGARIMYSLGNAVYPRMLKGADSGTMTIVTVPPASEQARGR